MKTFTLIIVLSFLISHRLAAEIVTIMTVGNSGSTNLVIQATSLAYTNTYSVVSNSEPAPVITGSISIRAGETVKILYYNAPNVPLKFNTGGRDVWMGVPETSGTPFFVGPGTLSLTLTCIDGGGAVGMESPPHKSFEMTSLLSRMALCLSRQTHPVR